jgi:predicted Zn-dependent protease
MSMPSDPLQFAGSLSDGRTAEATPVKVQLLADGLGILLPEQRKPQVWAYASLRSSVPMRRDAGDVLLSSLPNRDRTLFVADVRFPPKLLQRAPALSAARQRLRGLRPGVAVVALVACISGAVWWSGFEPAKAVASLMPQKSRELLGRNVVASLTSNRKPCETPSGRAALDRLSSRLTGVASPDGPLSVRVVLLDWGLVNAFAVPGAQIILTRGLVEQAGSSDEVAGVLAHELGHAIELHPEAGLVRALGLTAAAQLVFVGTSGTLSNLGLLLTQLRYTRVAEREADVHALRILMAAGISAKGFGDFFERLERRRPAGGGSGPRFSEIEVIRTHPLTADRIAMVRAQPAYDATPALSAEDWRALQRACGPAAGTEPPQRSGQEQVSRPDVPTKGSPSDAGKEGGAEADREIAAATKTLDANPGDVAARQKRARAYATRNKHAEALADYVKASQLKPQDAGLHYGRGLALHSLRRYEEALAAYDEALRLSANYAAARNGRGNTNRALRRYDAALLDFDELLKTQPNYAHGHYNRGLVHREMERLEDAIRDFDATLVRDKDYTAAYASRGMTHEKTGARDKAIADFRAALAAPAKYSNGAWAHRTARERLKALGVSDP